MPSEPAKKLNPVYITYMMSCAKLIGCRNIDPDEFEKLPCATQIALETSIDMLPINPAHIISATDNRRAPFLLREMVTQVRSEEDGESILTLKYNKDPTTGKAIDLSSLCIPHAEVLINYLRLYIDIAYSKDDEKKAITKKLIDFLSEIKPLIKEQAKLFKEFESSLQSEMQVIDDFIKELQKHPDTISDVPTNSVTVTPNLAPGDLNCHLVNLPALQTPPQLTNPVAVDSRKVKQLDIANASPEKQNEQRQELKAQLEELTGAEKSLIEALDDGTALTLFRLMDRATLARALKDKLCERLTINNQTKPGLGLSYLEIKENDIELTVFFNTDLACEEFLRKLFFEDKRLIKNAHLTQAPAPAGWQLILIFDTKIFNDVLVPKLTYSDSNLYPPKVNSGGTSEESASPFDTGSDFASEDAESAGVREVDQSTNDYVSENLFLDQLQNQLKKIVPSEYLNRINFTDAVEFKKFVAQLVKEFIKSELAFLNSSGCSDYEFSLLSPADTVAVGCDGTYFPAVDLFAKTPKDFKSIRDHFKNLKLINDQALSFFGGSGRWKLILNRVTLPKSLVKYFESQSYNLPKESGIQLPNSYQDFLKKLEYVARLQKTNDPNLPIGSELRTVLPGESASLLVTFLIQTIFANQPDQIVRFKKLVQNNPISFRELAPTGVILHFPGIDAEMKKNLVNSILNMFPGLIDINKQIYGYESLILETSYLNQIVLYKLIDEVLALKAEQRIQQGTMTEDYKVYFRFLRIIAFQLGVHESVVANTSFFEQTFSDFLGGCINLSTLESKFQQDSDNPAIVRIKLGIPYSVLNSFFLKLEQLFKVFKGKFKNENLNEPELLPGKILKLDVRFLEYVVSEMAQSAPVLYARRSNRIDPKFFAQKPNAQQRPNPYGLFHQPFLANQIKFDSCDMLNFLHRLQKLEPDQNYASIKTTEYIALKLCEVANIPNVFEMLVPDSAYPSQVKFKLKTDTNTSLVASFKQFATKFPGLIVKTIGNEFILDIEVLCTSVLQKLIAQLCEKLTTYKTKHSTCDPAKLKELVIHAVYYGEDLTKPFLPDDNCNLRYSR